MSDLNSYEESLAIDLAKAEARIEQLERENARLDAGWQEANVRALDAGLKLAKAVEALQAADLYIHDLETHEGAEGFSVSTAEASKIYHAVLAELEVDNG